MIEKERTGSAKEAAERIGISERMIFNYVRILKTELNAPINYNRNKQTYSFNENGRLIWKWITENN